MIAGTGACLLITVNAESIKAGARGPRMWMHVTFDHAVPSDEEVSPLLRR